MEKLKHWVEEHKAIAAGLGVGLLLLIYLWWRSGSSAAGSGGASNLDSYYAAAAQNAQADAALQAQQSQVQGADYLAQQQTTAQQEADQAAQAINASNNATQLAEVQAEVPVQQAQITSLQAMTNAANEAAAYGAYAQAYTVLGATGHGSLAESIGTPTGANPQNFPSSAPAYGPAVLAKIPPGLRHLYE